MNNLAQYFNSNTAYLLIPEVGKKSNGKIVNTKEKEKKSFMNIDFN